MKHKNKNKTWLTLFNSSWSTHKGRKQQIKPTPLCKDDDFNFDEEYEIQQNKTKQNKTKQNKTKQSKKKKKQQQTRATNAQTWKKQNRQKNTKTMPSQKHITWRKTIISEEKEASITPYQPGTYHYLCHPYILFWISCFYFKAPNSTIGRVVASEVTEALFISISWKMARLKWWSLILVE